MATNTTNFNLVKPAQDDFYDIDVQNGNMDIIDAELKKSKDHIANASNPHSVTKSQVGLGNVPNVATNDQTPTYTTASANTALTSGEKLSVAFGKIAKAISSLISHLANTSNPHSVTKSQVGLGSVPNVATNDQTPTYNDTTTLATLASGEKLSVAFPKIKLAITNLINHLANKSNPHSVTKSQVGLGNVENKSSATIRGEITSANVTSALGYTPPKQDTVYTHPTSSGNKHIPSGGSSGQILRWSADGTAVWGDDNDTKYSLPTGNASTIGGLKLSDSTSSTSSTSGGVAATPKAVKAAYDLANGAMPKTGGTFTNEVATTEYFKFVLDDTHYVTIGKSDADNFVIAVNNNGTWVDIIRAGKDGTWFDGAIASYVDAHTGNKSNPHGVTKSQVGLGNVTNTAQMPIAGGTFTGNAKAYSTNRSGECLRNIDVRNSAGTTSQSTNFIRFDRKA